MKTRYAALPALFLLLRLSGPAHGQTWDGGAATIYWSDANNWSGNSIPGSGASIQLAGASSYTVDLDGNRTAAALSFSGNNSYTLQSSILTLSSGNITTASPGSGSVTHSINSGVIFSSAANLSTAASTTLSLGGTVTGSTLTKTGAGTLLLSGAASFSGGATVSAGTLQIGNGTSGSFSGNILNNANVTFNNNSLLTYSGNISGSGTLIKSGSAGLQLTGTNTFSGGVTLSGGNIEIGNGGSTGSLTAAIDNSGIVIFNRTTDYAHSGNLTGGGAIYKVNSNTLTLTGTNTYSGATHIEGGTLSFATGSLGTSGTIRLSGGTLQWGTSNTTDISSRTVIVDDGGATFDTNGNNVNFANAIGNSDTGALTKSGNGTLTFSGSNTYTGGTNLNAGTLALNHPGALGSTGTIRFGGGVLQFSGNNTTDYSARLSTAAGQTYNFNTNGQSITLATGLTSSGGSLVKSGSGTLLLTGTNTYSGGTTINAGTLQIGNGTSGSIAGNILNNGSVTFNNNSLVTYSGNISGSGALLKSGGGGLQLTGAHTFSGGVTLSGGNIEIGNGGSTGSLAGAIDNSSIIIFNRTTGYAHSGNITGSGGLYKVNSNTLTLTGSNDYTGTTHLEGGILNFAAGSLGNGTIRLNGGTLQWSSANTTDISSRTVIVDSGGGTFDTNGNNVTLANTIGNSGSGALTKTGSATLTLSGNNTYTGGTNLNAGTLALNNAGALGTTGTISFGGGVLQFSSNNTTDYSARFSTAAGQAYNFDTNGREVKLATGLTSPGGSLVKSGTNALILTGTNTFTGGTTINAGTLQIGDGATGGTLAGNILNNATLYYLRQSDATLSGDISGSGTLKVEAPIHTLTLTGNNTFSGGVSFASTGALSNRLRIGNGGTTGSLSGNVNLGTSSGGELSFNRSDAITFAGNISGRGQVVQDGSGILTLTGSGLNDAGAAINAGTLQIGNGGTTGTITGDITNEAALSFNRADTFTYSRVVSGAGSVTHAGTGTLILTGNNTYTGTTTLNAGTLQIGNSGTSGAISGNLVNNSAVKFSRFDALTYSGNMSGSGSLTHDGAGTLTITGNLGHTGGTVLNNGILQIGDSGTTGTLSGNVTFNGETRVYFKRSDDSTYSGVASGSFGDIYKYGAGTLHLTGSGSNIEGLTISGGTVLIDGGVTFAASYLTSGYYFTDSTFTADGSGTMVVTGLMEVAQHAAGAVNITGGAALISSTAALAAASGFTGTSTVSGTNSKWINSGDATIDGTAILNISSGGIFRTGTFTGTTGSLTTNLNNGTLGLIATGSSAGPVTLASGGGTLEVAATQILSGAVSGTGALTKTGTGTLVLTASASHTGGTTISAGTLQIGNPTTGGSISGTIVNNAALALVNIAGFTFGANVSGSGSVLVSNATHTITGNLSHTGGTVLNGGSLQIGNNGTTGSLSGNVTFSGGENLYFYRSDSTTYSGVATGSYGDIYQAGTGTLHLTGSGSNIEGLTVTAGTAIIEGGITFTTDYLNAGYFGSPGTLTADGAGTTVTTRSVELANNSNGGLNVTGGAALHSATAYLSQTAGRTGASTISGANWTNSGDANVNGTATLSISSGGAFRTGSFSGNTNSLTITLDNGTLGVTGTGSTTSPLTLASGGGALEVASGATFTLSGNTSGTGGLIKTSAGTLILSGSNTYTGATNVSAGTLAVNSTNALPGSSAVTVSSGAALNLAGYSQGLGSLTGAGSVVIGDNLTVGALNTSTAFAGNFTGTGRLIKAGNGTWSLSGSGSVINGDLEVTGGGFAVTAGSLTATNAKLGMSFGEDISMTVSGATSAVTFSGTTNVGSLGKAVLNISNGGTFNGALLNIKSNTANVNVDGAGSVLNVTGVLNVGTNGVNVGNGIMTITNGGTVNSGSALIANGSVHMVTVDGAGSNWNIAGSLDAKSTLNISNGGKVIFNDLAGSNTIELDGGIVAATSTDTASANFFVLNSGGGTFNVADTKTFTLQPQVSGAGGLTKTGPGTLALPNVNTYAGNTIVTGGTLQIGSGNFGSIEGSILNNASVAFNRANDYDFNGAISGTGGVIHKGAGTLILSGDLTYTGITTVSAGTLQLNSTLSGNIINDGALNLDISGNSSYPGAISGTGRIHKSGAGTLTLSGANSYSGLTAVTAGVLKTSVAGALGNTTSALSVSNSTVDFAATAPAKGSTTLSGNAILQSTGGAATFTTSSLSATGTGNQIAANVTVSGPVTVSGALAVQGVLSGATQVNSGATLSGNGNFGTVTVTGGTLAPGNSPGQPTAVSAAFTGSGSTYSVEIVADGTASTGATSTVNANRYDRTTLSGTGSGAETILSLDSANSVLKLTISGTLQASGKPFPYLTTGGTATNTSFDNYFIFDLIDSADALDGRFAYALDGSGHQVVIDYGTNGVFPTNPNQIGTFNFASVGGAHQIYAISYTGNRATNSTFGGNDVVVSAIPEPGSLVMLLGGLSLLGLRRRRQG